MDEVVSIILEIVDTLIKPPFLLKIGEADQSLLLSAIMGTVMFVLILAAIRSAGPLSNASSVGIAVCVTCLALIGTPRTMLEISALTTATVFRAGDGALCGLWVRRLFRRKTSAFNPTILPLLGIGYTALVCWAAARQAFEMSEHFEIVAPKWPLGLAFTVLIVVGGVVGPSPDLGFWSHIYGWSFPGAFLLGVLAGGRRA